MVSPPRERPSASWSRPGLPGFVPAAGGFLSFGGAPRAGRGAQPGHRQPGRVDVFGRVAAGSGVLAGAHHRRIRRHRPRLALRLITPSPQPIQDRFPRPIPRPAAMPVIHRLPVPVLARQVLPRAPSPGPDETPLITVRWSFHRCPCRGCGGSSGTRRSHSSSVRSCRFRRSSTRLDLHEPEPKIYRTRPSPLGQEEGPNQIKCAVLAWLSRWRTPGSWAGLSACPVMWNAGSVFRLTLPLGPAGDVSER